MERLVDKESVDRIISMLRRDYQKARERMGNVLWRELPKAGKSVPVYGVDGSQGKIRLSGTILYVVSSVAFGSGPLYSMVYTNAMRYNHGISDQIIRLQMESLENKVGYLASKAEGVEVVMMDGTLTGSLTRPPVYPENVNGVKTIESILGRSELEKLIVRFKTLLDEHYRELEDVLSENRRIRKNSILVDASVEMFSDFYEKLEGHVPPNGRNRLSLEDSRNAIHVVLSYIEYLYSLDRLLGRTVVYIAKSFYTRRITEKLGIDVFDVPFLDAYLRSVYGEELPGYTVLKGRPVEHTIPDVMLRHFKNVAEQASKGISSAFIRTMKGGVIYFMQSNRRIDDGLLEMILGHESGGYFRPLQRAHETVKITNRTFEREVATLMNIIKSEAPELTVFFKYGRSPLE